MKLLTTDIYEGAYLLSHGMELNKLWLNGKNGKRSVVFEFMGNQLELLRKDYERGNASANVVKLKQSLTVLKDRMFDLLRTAETERRQRHEYQLTNI